MTKIPPSSGPIGSDSLVRPSSNLSSIREIYIFTIITIATRPFLILRMKITYLAHDRSLKFDFYHICACGTPRRPDMLAHSQHGHAKRPHCPWPFLHYAASGPPSPSPSLISLPCRRRLLPQPATASCSHPAVLAPSEAITEGGVIWREWGI